MFFNYSPFNLCFFLVLAISFVLYRVCLMLCRRKGRAFAKKLLMWIMIAAFLCFFGYKYCLSVDAEYAAIPEIAAVGPFDWWAELPLYLCNVNIWLLPIGLALNNRTFLSFCFFTGPVGALMALIMPCAGFYDCSIFLPRMIGYLGLHLIGFWGCLSLYPLGFYSPEYKDAKSVSCFSLLLITVIYGIIRLLRWAKLSAEPNYFYLIDPKGNPILEMLHNLIPYEFLYILPCLIIVVLICLLFTAFVKIVKPPVVKYE